MLCELWDRLVNNRYILHVVKMAEMYADLMELNERLHRDLADKDSTIATLVRSLKESSLEVSHSQCVDL